MSSQLANIAFATTLYLCSVKRKIEGNMNAENNIRVGLVRTEGDVAPFVKVNYMDKDAQECTG